MIIELPRGIKVDTAIYCPDELTRKVQKEFKEYTSGTNPKYMYQDKLCFIDMMAQNLHHADAANKVNAKIKDYFAFQLDELGEFPCESDFLSIGFMEDCYDLGRKDQRLCSHNFCKDPHTCENIMRIEAIVIKAVMDYEEEKA